MAMLLITHDLGVVARSCDRTAGDVCRPGGRAGPGADRVPPAGRIPTPHGLLARLAAQMALPAGTSGTAAGHRRPGARPAGSPARLPVRRRAVPLCLGLLASPARASPGGRAVARRGLRCITLPSMTALLSIAGPGAGIRPAVAPACSSRSGACRALHGIDLEFGPGENAGAGRREPAAANPPTGRLLCAWSEPTAGHGPAGTAGFLRPRAQRHCAPRGADAGRVPGPLGSLGPAQPVGRIDCGADRGAGNARAPRPAGPGCRSCWSGGAARAARRHATRTNSPAASASASASPARWRPRPDFVVATSRSPPWTCRCRRRC